MKKSASQPSGRSRANQKSDATSAPASTECKENKDDDAFAKAFKSSCKLLELSPELFGDEPKVDDSFLRSQRSRTKRRIRRLELEITPAAKSAAIERNRPLKQAALREIRQHGAPDNISKFMKELGKPEDRAAREVVRKAFALKGSPGRKPGRKPD
jgi:hypothetical protein